MDNSFQTSFIPKKPISQSTNLVSGKEPVNFFYVIATILLIISILASGGLFGYKLYLTKQKETLSNSLIISRDSFEKETINELDLFYQKSKTAREILENHVTLSSIFSLLGEITIPQIQYTSFDAQFGDKGILSVNISGIADDYKSIALQANVFNTTKASSFKNVLFSNLSKDKNNNVTFNLSFDIDSSLYSYEKNILSDSSISSSSSSSSVSSSSSSQSTQSSDAVTAVSITEIDNNINDIVSTQEDSLQNNLENNTQ